MQPRSCYLKPALLRRFSALVDRGNFDQVDLDTIIGKTVERRSRRGFIYLKIIYILKLYRLECLMVCFS
jgi:hypothetical protein